MQPKCTGSCTLPVKPRHEQKNRLQSSMSRRKKCRPIDSIAPHSHECRDVANHHMSNRKLRRTSRPRRLPAAIIIDDILCAECIEQNQVSSNSFWCLWFSSLDGACEKGYVQCGKDRCVLVNHVCQGHANACPEVDRSAICPHNSEFCSLFPVSFNQHWFLFFFACAIFLGA